MVRDALCDVARGAFRGGTIVTAATCKEAHAALESVLVFDLILTDAVFPDGDILDLAPRWNRLSSRRPRVLVVTRRKEPRVLECIQLASIFGVFDLAEEGMRQLREALKAVSSGREYASPSIAKKIPRFLPLATEPVLTPLERLVLAAIGDGSSDDAAATRLKRSPQTIKTMRGWLHEKLRVNNRGELIHAAVRLGFVCFTDQGIVRPGFKRLLNACPRRIGTWRHASRS